MRRRQFLQYLGGLTGTAAFSNTAISEQLDRAAGEPQKAKLPALREDQALFINKSDQKASFFARSHNLRTQMTPELRVLCKTPEAVAHVVHWAREHDVPFAMRSGGHCFETFSQSAQLVIDTRLLSKVSVDPATKTVIVGAGAKLASIYKAVHAHGLALSSGMCQSVGAAGLTLGGGVGMLSRVAGLTCDVLEAIDIVDAEGRLLRADTGRNTDLYWASRGGGGGSFGIATQFRYKLIDIRPVVLFEKIFRLSPENAVNFLAAWELWAPAIRDEITSVLNIMNYVNGDIFIIFRGVALTDENTLRQEIKRLIPAHYRKLQPVLRSMSYLEACNYLYAPGYYPVSHYKYKSDYARKPFGQDGWNAMVSSLSAHPVNAVKVTCEPYGGAIARVKDDETAFPHRAGTLFGMQYSAEYSNEKQKVERMSALSDVYKAMRPFVSGGAYVNYPDMELNNWATAYWGDNLGRLKRIKMAYDPDNIFRHAQSVPLI